MGLRPRPVIAWLAAQPRKPEFGNGHLARLPNPTAAKLPREAAEFAEVLVLGGMALEFFAGHRAQVHLVGALGHAQRAGPCVEVGQREVAAQSAGTVDLNGPVDDRAGNPGHRQGVGVRV